jgi:leucine dehydrogenase
MPVVKDFDREGSISLFKQLADLEHEQIVFCHDQQTGLKAIIAIHNTVLGPSMGGTRMWNYASEREAITDVLRLSRGMTYKAAISGLNIGGGKAIIIGDASTMKTEALLRRFGRFIDSLGGKYVTAEDVNMNTDDMHYIAMETRHVTGLHESRGGGGDPSPFTAYGTYLGIKASVKNVYGSDSLEGKRIAVQGVGQVGGHLVEYLKKENAQIFISDISAERLKKVASSSGATVVTMDQVFGLDVDILSPCALGGIINDDTIPQLKCKVICGAANNQLLDEQKHGRVLMEKSITYAPDFLVNAGGIINVSAEYLGEYSRESVFHQTEKIYQTCLDILNKSQKEKIPSQQAAIDMAKQRIEQIGKLKTNYKPY